jgi:hypothetical protein
VLRDAVGMSYTEERTYPKLLAKLDKKPTVWAECLSADPIADIAVLGTPDNQSLFEVADDYERLTEKLKPIEIGDGAEKGPGWLLSLTGEWFECVIECEADWPLYISQTTQPIRGGMSGSPVISAEGAAIGIVTLGNLEFDVEKKLVDQCLDSSGIKNPRLVRDLPGWLIREKLERARSAWVKSRRLDHIPIIEGFREDSTEA